MIVLRMFFCVLILQNLPAMIYAQDDQSGFISIDCGSASNYTQEDIGVNYVSDDGFIEGGVSHDISRIHNYTARVYNTLRTFPENKRNCYTLRPQKGKNNRYLIRAKFYYGNYDGKGQSPIFDLYIGADYWVTVYISDPATYVTHEMIHFTSSNYINVCLVNTDQGDPFITSLELRLLDITMYNHKDQSRSLVLFDRFNFGTNETVRYEDDKYDRIWGPVIADGCTSLQTSDAVSLGPNNDEQVPAKVMSTAITPINSTHVLYYSQNANTADEFIIYIHLAEVEILETHQMREFNIYFNGILIGTVSPSTSITTIVKEVSPGLSSYEFTLERTLNSTLPPILNAFEVYKLKKFLQNQTDDQDVAAIWSIKSIYGLIKLNWQGDPCVPEAWVGLNCSYNAEGAAKIIFLNLSSRGLSGEIATSLANLTKIESLDLSYNNLTGNVPDFLSRLDNLRTLNLMGNNFTRPLPAELLAKSKNGSLWLSIEESSGVDKSSSLQGSRRNNKHKIAVILAPIVGCIIVLGGV